MSSFIIFVAKLHHRIEFSITPSWHLYSTLIVRRKARKAFQRIERSPKVRTSKYTAKEAKILSLRVLSLTPSHRHFRATSYILLGKNGIHVRPFTDVFCWFGRLRFSLFVQRKRVYLKENCLALNELFDDSVPSLSAQCIQNKYWIYAITKLDYNASSNEANKWFTADMQGW